MTTVEHAAFASPLSLLGQWRDDLLDGPPLRELVVLGYTLDLAFLERFCVPPARQLGARVTVLADAGQGMHDAVDVRFAGRSYQHGVAALKGAFHPKVAVLLGDEHVWVAIGSGNPTMAGWGHNHELWCVVRGRTAQGPQVQADIGAWLSRLPEHVPMPSWIAATLTDVGRRLVPDTVDDTHPDVWLLHNLDRSLMDQLPPGPTIELRLAAPFIDPSGRAVRELLDRVAPQRLRVALQRDLSSFDGRALVAAAETVGDIEFRDVDVQRTMHGKLIEWTTPNGQTTAVVGSPNVTSAALLGTVAAGHNCELAMSAPVTASLLPDAEPLAAAEVATKMWNRPDISVGGPGLRLLGCRRSDDGLGIEMVSRHAVDMTVETSVDGSPGSWGAKAVVPAAAIVTSGITTAVIDVPEVIGGAVRVVAIIGGNRVETAPVFVTDVRRCRPRTDVGDAPRLRQEYEIDQLITDESLASRFSFDFLRLLDHSARTRAAAARPAGSVESGVHADVDRWQRFLDVVSYSLGTSLTELAFPGALPAPVTAQTTSWSVADIADETELAEGETDAIEEIDPSTVRPARRVPRELRGRYRGWMRRWVSAVTRPPARRGQVPAIAPALPLRMTVAAIYLELLAAGVWGAEDGWRGELADLVTAIVADPAELGDTPHEGHGYLGSLVAVCLAILLQDASLHGGTPADIVARRAWEAGHEAATGAETAVVEALLLTSTQADARLATPSEVSAVVDLACDALVDPNAEALAGLSAEGLDVERRHGTWVVHGGFRNPMRVAARVVTELAAPEGTAVVASNGGRSTVMVRRGQMLAMADSTVRRWRIYQVRPPSTPASIFNGSEGVPPTRQTAPLMPVPAEVLALGAEMDVDVGRLIGEFLPGPVRNAHGGTTDWDW